MLREPTRREVSAKTQASFPVCYQGQYVIEDHEPCRRPSRPRLCTNEGGSPQLRPRRKNLFYRGVLGSNITVNLVAVGVVVGQRGVNLS